MALALVGDADQPAAGRGDRRRSSAAASRSAARPASRSPAATPSIRSSRSTAWSCMGLVHPDKVRRNADAKAGDVLVLGKPLGVGVLSAALKKEQLDAAGYAQLIATHDAAQHARHRARRPGRRACDHRRHRLRPGRPRARAGARRRPARRRSTGRRCRCCAASRRWRRDGFVTGASGRNWAGYGAEVALDAGAAARSRSDLLTDPQTSGGLLVSCDPGVGERGAGRVSRRGLRRRRGRRRGARRCDRAQRPGLRRRGRSGLRRTSPVAQTSGTIAAAESAAPRSLSVPVCQKCTFTLKAFAARRNSSIAGPTCSSL